MYSAFSATLWDREEKHTVLVSENSHRHDTAPTDGVTHIEKCHKSSEHYSAVKNPVQPLSFFFVFCFLNVCTFLSLLWFIGNFITQGFK